MFPAARLHHQINRRLRLLTAGGLAAVAMAGVAAEPSEALAAGCANANARPAAASSATIARATACVMNAERRRHGLAALSLNQRLSKAARAHSRDMVERDYFAHTAPGGGTFVARIRRSGYLRATRRWRVGENIAWGVSASNSPRSIVQGWMDSPPHRKEILTRSYRDVGLGVAAGVPSSTGGQGATYTADFGVKRLRGHGHD